MTVPVCTTSFPAAQRICRAAPHQTYRIEALQPEAVGSPALAAVHVVPEGQHDLRRCKGSGRAGGLSPAVGARPHPTPPRSQDAWGRSAPPTCTRPGQTSPQWDRGLAPLTSRMLRSLLEDLRDMEAAMMALSC